MLSSIESPTSAPAMAPPAPNSAAPIKPKASTGPTPGTNAVATIMPACKPPATPSAPPTVPPRADPMPGCSVSDVGMFASISVSAVRGESTLICLSAIPRDRSIAAARFASANELKMPTTVFMCIILREVYLRVVCHALEDCGYFSLWPPKSKRTATEHVKGIHTSWCYEIDEVKKRTTRLGFYDLFFVDVLEMKRDGAANHFFQSNTSRFVFGSVDIDPRSCAALKLFAAFSGKDDQAVL